MTDHSRLEITPEELVARFEAGAPLAVLDVRAEHRLASGTLDLVPGERFYNVRGSRLLAAGDPAALGLPRDLPLAVVCGLGNDSLTVAAHLQGHGFEAFSVKGGLAAWMATLIPRRLAPSRGLDALVQLDRIGKGALGYLLASAGEALVVDPARHLAPYLDLAARSGLRISGVLDTHAHADYISGGPALAGRLGVPYYLHPLDAVYPYDGTPGRIAYHPLADGDRLPLGRAEIVVAHTPGHTEGSVSLLVDGELALTGDLVFVASVGRPDLGGKMAEWTQVLFTSLARARRDWPAAARVLPAHYASDAERNPDRSVGAPFDRLLATNEPLAITDPAAFQAWMEARQAPFPDSCRRIKAVNVGLLVPTAGEADELEVGRNQCALGGPPRT